MDMHRGLLLVGMGVILLLLVAGCSKGTDVETGKQAPLAVNGDAADVDALDKELDTSELDTLDSELDDLTW
ncbi:hypothetical protein HY497_01275 [Candidatus Woesearchaeota archaeon]|nr:hypothetical protein [Candidatus Woesearchaeota archaeon]